MDGERNIKKYNSMVVGAIAVAVSLFHLLNVAGVITISTMPMRVIHLCAMMLIIFLTKGVKTPGVKRTVDMAVRVVGLVLTLVCSVYLLLRYEDIANSGGHLLALCVA